MSAKPKILVVDDEAVLRDLIRSSLEDDYEVLLASDGMDAVQCYSPYAGLLALVITDVQMPRLNGCEFVVWLRDQGADTPIIMMSGGADQSTVEWVRQMKPHIEWLPKPFTTEQLMVSINRAIKVRRLD